MLYGNTFLLKCCHLHFGIKNKRSERMTRAQARFQNTTNKIKKKKNEGNYLTDLTNEQRKECVNG